MKPITESLGKLTEGIVNEVSKAWENTVKTFSSMASGFENIKSSLSNKISETKNTVRDTIENTKNWFGDLWNRVRGHLPRNRREVGGPVIRGTSYIVGERGPEIYTPGENGTISTNRELRALNSGRGGGGSISANFNIAINVNGNMAPGDVESLRTPVLRIIEEAWASATQGTVSRGAVV
jgi:hypothetical protein